MIRAATPKEINEAFTAARERLGRVMTWEEIQALDASLARPIERDPQQSAKPGVT
jgi:hypothetical protein